MVKIFVRERRKISKGAGRPRFAIVATEGTDLKLIAPHIRKYELEALASAVGAEVTYLARAEKSVVEKIEPEEVEESAPKSQRKGKKSAQE